MGSGTYERQGNTLSTGASGGYKYVKFLSTSFNSTTGVTTVTYETGFYVSYGNFYGATFTNYGSNTAQFTVSGPASYGTFSGPVDVAHDSYIHFYEGAGYTSYSAGYLSSTVDFYWYPDIPTYTITYNANSGSGAPSSQSKSWGTELTLSTTVPTRSGYKFLGWGTSSSATTATYQPGGTYPATSNANQTLYAVWRQLYTISYNGNGTTTNVPSSQTKEHGIALTLSSVKPTRSGYKFLGWATSSSATTAAYQPGGTYPATSNANQTLYAVWQADASITSLTAVRGTGTTSSTFVENTEGTVVRIMCVWSNPNNASVTISGTVNSTAVASSAFTTTTSGTTRTSTAYYSSVGTDAQATVTVSLTLNSVVVSSKSVLVTKTAFLLDFGSSGKAIGIFSPASTSATEPTLDMGVVPNLPSQSRYYVFAAPNSAAGVPSFRALSATDIQSGTLAIARGGTGKSYGYQWQQLATWTGSTARTISLTNYSEVMVLAKTSGYLGSVVIPKAALTTSDQELYLSGSYNGGTNGRGFAVNIKTTQVTPVAAFKDSADVMSATTWFVYAR